jgi:putative heme-binding domain-containing protein
MMSLVLTVLGLGAVAEAGSDLVADPRPPEPQPSAAWATGPLDVVVAFPRPVQPEVARGLVGRSISYTASSGRPPDRPAITEPPRTLRIAGARLTDGGHTLLLATDPHPAPTRYALAPTGNGPAFPAFEYDLSGVEVTWIDDQAADDEPAWKGWWPSLDLASVRVLGQHSVPHERLLGMLSRPGRLTLGTLVKLPANGSGVRIESNRAITEASLGDATAEPQDPAKQRPGAITLPDASKGQPQFLSLTVVTGPGPPLSLCVAHGKASREGPFPPIERERLTLPWVTTPSAAEPTPAVVPRLEGGDAKRGEMIFLGEQARCAQCHAFRGRGAAIGPDLSEISRKGREHVYRSIAAPSAEIAPEYLPYTVAVRDGRVLAGLVRAAGPDAITVTDNSAKSVTLRRDQIEQIRPSGTSIMPVGLAGSLGEPALRDLFAYLFGSAGQ